LIVVGHGLTLPTRRTVTLNRLDHHFEPQDPEHEKLCREACCRDQKTDEPDWTPIVGDGKQPKEKLYGLISIKFNLQDDDAQPQAVSILYSTDGARSFKKCTPWNGSFNSRSLPTCPHGIRHTFTWDSEADLKHRRYESVRVMILVHGNNGCVLNPFTVDNRVLSPLSDEDIEDSA
jgi:hypothetical protein